MSDERGFTLIEMLVALALFSLAALALLRLQGASLGNAAALQDQAIGQIVARNVAVETLTDPVAPSIGVSRGIERNAARDWRWTRRTSAAGPRDVQRVDIAVINEAGRTVAGLVVFRSAI